jgi:hypothetical protein
MDQKRPSTQPGTSLDTLNDEELAEYFIDSAVRDMSWGIKTLQDYYAKHPMLVAKQFYAMGCEHDALGKFLESIFKQMGDNIWKGSSQAS